MPPGSAKGFGRDVLRSPAWRSRSTLLVALLTLGTLALAGVMAYEAYDASRSHRATAERALRDYAAFAAWELLASATDNLRTALDEALTPATGVKATSPYERLPSPAMLAPLAENTLACKDTAADAARYYFRLDFRDGSLATSGTALTPRERAWLTDTITAHARGVYQPGWRYAIVRGRGPAERRALVYGVKYAEHGAPIAAYGFSTCASAFGAPLFQPVMDRHPLLPSSLVGHAPNDSLVSAIVLDLDGHVLYRSAAQGPSPFTAQVTTGELGGLTARAALRPRAIERLAVGTMPRSRLPLLLGLLALTAGMVVVTLLQLRREQELARLRSNFISSVSHELRTPLAQILLFAETLSLGRVRSDRERRSAADVIVQEARRLVHLVENVLHFSRAERRMARLVPEPIALAPYVREIVDSWLPLAQAADVVVRTELDAGVIARADRAALRQMLLNLLDNAVKYGRAGQTVTVGLAAAGDRARLWVDDEGPGIPTEARAQVWEPFYRMERDVNSAIAGSGIGLFVVRELAGLHGGRAWVEAAPGGGARFVIELLAVSTNGSGPLGSPPSRRSLAQEASR